MSKETDDRFWEKLRKDDNEAIIFLYKIAYKEMLQFGLRFCLNKDLVKDAIHDVFINIWIARHTLNRINNLKGYLLISLRNILRRQISRENKYSCIEIMGYDDLFSESSAEDLLMLTEQDQVVRRRIGGAMEKLSPRQREVIRMKYYDGFSMTRIKQLTGMETQTIYNTIYNAMKVLGNELVSCPVAD